jgi:ubiquinone/menaquinone biosynthesis C-methylase UbiE
MVNPFDVAHLAAGYANARPPVHAHIIDRLRARLPIAVPVRRALDVGCGAGSSTAALSGIARWLMGIDPSPAMLKWAARAAAEAHFVVAAAEALPVRKQSIDLLTAAGSLNWVDLSRFFPEATRALAPRGALAIYDFAAGRAFRDDEGLSHWYNEFERRYPSPACQEIDPASLDLESYGLALLDQQAFAVSLVLDPAFYLSYVMTETNVGDAVRRGTARDEIREWCQRTLAPVFFKPREVVFKGYLALATRR